ncbi:hypothetical protein [Streptomyces collinus]|uniref:hypothetical protein n=1 Tax=Streptomyces collinus TaxID=42684 RepID=UPI0033C85C5B
MRAHHAKRALACVAASFLLAGGTAIGTAGMAAAAAPAATTASVPTGGKCSKWQWHYGYYDSNNKWHKGYWVCTSRPIDNGTNLNPVSE